MSPRMHRREVETLLRSLDQLESTTRDAAKNVKHAFETKKDDPLDVDDGPLNQVSRAAKDVDDVVKGSS